MSRTDSGAPQISIIIVSWNVRDLLRNCLHSIERGRGDLSLETIVVDSGSTDGTAEAILTEFPDVRLIAHPDNVGFPRGNNIGLSAASGRYFFLLNPDTEVVGDALSTLAEYLDNHSEVGVVGPQLRYPDGQIQPSRRRFPTLATAFLESTWLQSWAPSGVIQRYYVEDKPDNQPADVDWVVGAALMTRRAVVEDVGLLDEGYFMYSEELDWCRRIRAAGWGVRYLPSARIIHHVGQSSNQVVGARHIYFQRAKLRYFRKYHGQAVYVSLRAFLLLIDSWQLILEAGKWLLGHRRSLRRQRVRAYWQLLKTGLPAAGNG